MNRNHVLKRVTQRLTEVTYTIYLAEDDKTYTLVDRVDVDTGKLVESNAYYASGIAVRNQDTIKELAAVVMADATPYPQ